jgi:hypothetical protein
VLLSELVLRDDLEVCGCKRDGGCVGVERRLIIVLYDLGYCITYLILLS